MNKSYKKSAALRTALVAVIVTGLVSGSAVYAKWSFGVMGDTQQGSSPFLTLSSIAAINSKFIEKGVKFVVQVGDQVNVGGNLADRAAATEPLYQAGIGFFPMRGNHELFLPASVATFREVFPQTQGISNTFGAGNFTSPVLAGDFPDDLKGLSYSFDYSADGGSVRIVIIDDWPTPNKTLTVPAIPNYPCGYSVGEQQSWISERLNKDSRKMEHAFVIAHHNMIPEYHFDCLFTGLADANIDMQNAFYGSLFGNNVKYYISGHEHIYNRCIDMSPDGKSPVQEITCSSAGAKFMNPTDPSAPLYNGQRARQTQLAQELNNIGFYIYTVDGPSVTVDYYSDSIGGFKSAPAFPAAPVFNFIKKETFGYSLNGKEFLVDQGGAYGDIEDQFQGTRARVVSGYNQGRGADFWARKFTKSVSTGWSTMNDDRIINNTIFTLWGMADFNARQTDIFAVKMTFKHGHEMHGMNEFGILCVRDAQGNWINAVDKNTGGKKTFVAGDWKPEYGLGTYGVDDDSKTVWAVVNYNSDFAVVTGVELEPPHKHDCRHSENR